MIINSRVYGCAENHKRYVVFNCTIQKRDNPENKRIGWKVKKNWNFECVKYEFQDYLVFSFNHVKDYEFIIKLLDFSDHAVYDCLYKHDSDFYVCRLLKLYLTQLFEDRYSFPDFMKFIKVFDEHIQMC